MEDFPFILWSLRGCDTLFFNTLVFPAQRICSYELLPPILVSLKQKTLHCNSLISGNGTITAGGMLVDLNAIVAGGLFESGAFE